MTPEWIGSLMRLMGDSPLRICVVAVAVGAILLAARVQSGGVRHAAWSAVLAVMLLMPALTDWMPSIAVPLPAQAMRVGAVPRAIEVAWNETTAEPAAVSPALPSTAPISASGTRGAPAVRQPRVFWPFAAVGVYLVGALLLLSRLLHGWLAVQRVVRSSAAISDLRTFRLPAEARTSGANTERGSGLRHIIPQAKAGLSDLRTVARLLESPDIAAPMTVGILAPNVLLPCAWRSWPDEKLRAVLAHELAHVQRRDTLVALVARLNLCLFWFHPVAWWLERTLATTAEHACDEAGARVMEEKRRYAEVLLDMAEAVRRAGGRLTWNGIGVHGTGLLGQRIDRVLRGDLFREVSMTRKVIVTVSCAAAIFIVVACRQRAAAVPPLKDDPAYVSQQAQNRARIEAERAAREMTASQVADVEAVIQKNPEDVAARKKLLTFALPFGVPVPGEQDKWAPRCAQVLGTDPCIALRRAQILWLIDHHPDSDALGNNLGRIAPEGGHLNDPIGYAEAKKLWLAKTRPADTGVAVLGNAADFFEYADKPLAEQVLLRAQASGAAWAPRRLGRLYAAAILGAPSLFFAWTTNPDEVRSPFAAQVRKTLEESKDARLLAEAAWWLNTGGSRTPESVEAVALAKACAERALQLDPQSSQAHVILVSQREREAYRRLRAAVGNTRGDALYKAVSALPDAERFEFLPRLATEAYMWADYLESTRKTAEAGAERERARKYAEDVLALAPRFRDSETYGTAMYVGNLVLAGVTFRDGDGQKAGKYLVEASKAPSNDDLRYSLPGPGFQLLGFMLKYGVRDPVVEFLDRMGKVNVVQGQYYLREADQIRKGYRPIYYPRERPYYPGIANE